METFVNSRILIIDDNREIHEDFRKILNPENESQAFNEIYSSLFGKEQKENHPLKYQIDSAYQGKEGLEMVKQALKDEKPYALAFVDVLMPPGWDGVETVQEIWKVDPEIQVAICTAYADYSWEEIIKNLGVTDQLLILKKPFDVIEIRQMACCLVKKWNLGQQVGHQFDKLGQALRDQSTKTGNLITDIDPSADAPKA
jgi:CheY-like chemotaxis protein